MYRVSNYRLNTSEALFSVSPALISLGVKFNVSMLRYLLFFLTPLPSCLAYCCGFRRGSRGAGTACGHRGIIGGAPLRLREGASVSEIPKHSYFFVVCREKNVGCLLCMYLHLSLRRPLSHILLFSAGPTKWRLANALL